MNPRIAISILVLFALVMAAVPAQKQLSDDALYDMVRRKLANDQILKGGALQVEVKDGAVTLRGPVESEKLKERASKLAKKVKGVRAVNNQLVVTEKGR